MTNFFKRLINWFSQEGRTVSLALGIILSILFGMAAGIVSAFIIQYDAWKYNGKLNGQSLFDKDGGWNWVGLSVMLLGSLVGGAVHLLVF